MVPEADNLTNVGSPGWVEAEAAELRLTKTTPKEVITQPINCLIHLLATSNITQCGWINNECLSIIPFDETNGMMLWMEC